MRITFFCRRALACTTAGLLILSSQLQSQVEIFPLRANSYFKYAYCGRQWGGNVLDGYTTVLDSGIVEYTVRDSAFVNDTTAIWNVIQEYAILHSYRNTLGADSLFWTADSSIVSIKESTTGRHPLSIVSRVWAFPLTYASDPSQPVYRYADSSQVLLAFLYQFFGTPVGRDSLWFSRYSGLYRRNKTAYFSAGMSSYSNTLSIQLLSNPILSVSYFGPPSSGPRLMQNYPNPFNPTTNIEYYLPEQSFVTLDIYDILGRKIASIVGTRQASGTHHVLFNGAQLSSGIYFCHLHAVGTTYTRKMIIQK